MDACTVTAIGADGLDRWRAAPDGVRKLEGPFPCESGALFHGLSGLQRVAVQITERGSVIRETTLKRGAVLIGTGPSCEPLVWERGEIALLDPVGLPLWRRESKQAPFIHPLTSGFAIVRIRKDNSLTLEVLTHNGRVVTTSKLPVSGRITSVEIIPGENLTVKGMGLCLDVTSPCSQKDETRGPYNALITSAGQNQFHVRERHVQGHLNFAPYPDNGFVAASSREETGTNLVLRDRNQDVLWQTDLPGRLSAGPYVGPSGEVYLATCQGWDCLPPHLLIAVTGKAPPPKDDDEKK